MQRRSATTMTRSTAVSWQLPVEVRLWSKVGDALLADVADVEADEAGGAAAAAAAGLLTVAVLRCGRVSHVIRNAAGRSNGNYRAERQRTTSDAVTDCCQPASADARRRARLCTAANSTDEVTRSEGQCR